MALTDQSDIFASVTEDGFNRFAEHIMRTLRSLTFRAAPNARELSLLRAMSLEVINYITRTDRGREIGGGEQIEQPRRADEES